MTSRPSFPGAEEFVPPRPSLRSLRTAARECVATQRAYVTNLLGATAAHAVLGKDFRLTEERGRLHGWPEEWPGAVSVRSPDALVADLSVAAEALAGREA
ncbi:hypothetical protein [Mumia zhuanghuii]|uniref:Uncharacterized protein n=1 Tax=Mumia zhuanghuii TaxID=2585211 RepID=A0A5C4MVP9_9ACTN|nr:hypothetical protein [Mumia zhuanghuii]TNC33228.1 hypothetical protein FHE65_29330 [Mumia zhuanghuii]TNC49098.1 hypothetical protein FHE65_06170 [Mumia zhuanghuii]